MVALVDLAPASFRGAPFLVPKDHVAQGPNVVDHKFPGQGRRYAEYNGATPPEFHLTCVLHGPNLLSDWSRLEAALNQPQSGTLQHPWFGRRECAVKGPYKVNREDKDSGVLELEVCFLETKSAPLTDLPIPLPATISTLADSTIVGIFDDFGGGFSALFQFNPFSALFVFGVIRSIASLIQGLFSSTGSISAAATAVSAAGAQVQAADLVTLFQAPFDDPTVSNAAIVTAYSAVFDALATTAIEIDAINPTTQDLLERQVAGNFFVVAAMSATFAALTEGMAAKASTTLRATNPVNAVSSSVAIGAAGSDYQVAEDVENDMAILDAAWEILSARAVDVQGIMPAPGSPTQQQGADLVRSNLAALYTGVGTILQALEVTLPRVVVVDVPALPASVLSYWLYDTDANTDALVALNATLPPWLFDGDASVLSQ